MSRGFLLVRGWCDDARRRKLLVARNGSARIPPDVGPDSVPGTLTDRPTTTVAEMAFEISALQAAS
jgi:hypothetical protein